MTARFTLDVDRARVWLWDAVKAYPDGTPATHPETGEELPEIDAGWEPRDAGEEYNVETVVRLACENGIIGAPDDMTLEFEYVADLDGGYYRFIVRIGPRVTLASPSEEMRRVGARDTEGIAAAMSILREAVDSANGALEALGEYVTARTGA